MSELCNALAPLHYGTKVLGLSPYARVGNAYKTSRIGVLVVLGLSLVHLLGGFVVLKDFRFHRENVVIMMVVKFRIYGTYLTTLLMYATEIRAQSTVSSMLKTLTRVDATLKSLGAELSYGEAKVWIGTSVALLHAFSFLTAVLDFASHKDHLRDPYWIQWTLLFIVPSIVNGSVSCIICIYATLAKQRFRILNEAILRKVALGVRLQNRYRGYDLKIRRYRAKCIVKRAKGIHYDLTLMVLNFASVYSLPILFIIEVASNVVFSEIYYTVSGCFQRSTEVFEPVSFSHNIAVIIFNFGALSALIFCIEFCSQEAKNTAAVLFEIASSSSSLSTINSIRSFALQMGNTPVRITAAGLFEVNAKLLASIVGSMSTFMMILIQFEMSDHNKS